MVQIEGFMFQNVAFRPTVYRTGPLSSTAYTTLLCNIYLLTEIFCVCIGIIFFSVCYILELKQNRNYYISRYVSISCENTLNQ